MLKSAPKPDLRDLSPIELEAWVVSRGGERYRAAQVLKWLYPRRATDFASMKDLPLELRRELESAFSLFLPLVVKRVSSADGAEKLLLELRDGERIEAVYLPEGGRATLCVSTQAGCRMACRFCRTGFSGFRRQLQPSEIVGQILALDRPPTNLVFMGMGEPLDNLENLLISLRLICEPKALGFSPRRLTVSTIGLEPGVLRLVEQGPPVNLAVSLHSAVPETRALLMPAARGQDLASLKKTLQKYLEAGGRKITLEVVLIAGENDSAAEARALARWASGLSAKVNLIPFNPFPESGLTAPAKTSVLAYQQILRQKGVGAFIRKSRGQDILAACGQLRA